MPTDDEDLICNSPLTFDGQHMACIVRELEHWDRATNKPIPHTDGTHTWWQG